MAKKLFQSSIYLIALTIVSIVGAILINAALAAYVGPTANPPSSNVNSLLSSGTDASLLTLTLTGTTLTLNQTTNARFYANASKGFQVRLDSDNNDANAEFAINNGANAEVFKVDESGNVTATGGIRLGNYAEKPACSAGILGSMVFDTANDKPYVCGAGGIWKPLDSDYDKDGIVDWNDQDDTDATKKTATLIPENIKSGVTIFGVTGTASSGPVPQAPTGLAVTVENTSSGQIKISWTAPYGAVDQYKIYRGTAAGSLSQVGAVSSPTVTYTNTGLTNNTTYYFAVSAVNTTGEGVKSSVVPGSVATCYTDADGDNYGAAFSYYRVNGCSAGAVAVGGDCADTNYTGIGSWGQDYDHMVNPSGSSHDYSYQTGQYTSTYDWNCDGQQTKVYTQVSPNSPPFDSCTTSLPSCTYPYGYVPSGGASCRYMGGWIGSVPGCGSYGTYASYLSSYTNYYPLTTPNTACLTGQDHGSYSNYAYDPNGFLEVYTGGYYGSWKWDDSGKNQPCY
ncbi:MAG: fibronectin type III domain-containing protein [Patescibacteria group bacterium]